MQLGFVSAILAELDLEGVLKTASELGFTCVELMCWPPGKSERRYAGVTHIDATEFGAVDAKRVHELLAKYKLTISGLGYYPNALSADEAESRVAIEHVRKVIDAAKLLGVDLVNTFAGRNPALSVEASWPKFLEVWRPLVDHAEKQGVRLAFEHCPMLFTADEWPGGKNLPASPALWRRMFADIPNKNFGLNYDPSHFVWQMMDYVAPLYEFRDRIFHVHAKDARIDRQALNDHGVLAYPKLWHTPKIPGMGDVRWGPLCGALADIGYDGPVVIEVEDRAFEGSLDRRRESLAISRRYLLQFLGG